MDNIPKINVPLTANEILMLANYLLRASDIQEECAEMDDAVTDPDPQVRALYAERAVQTRRVGEAYKKRSLEILEYRRGQAG